MDNKIRILLADSTEKALWAFASDLAREPDLTLVGQTCDGNALIELVAKTRPDAIIMELVLDGIDGLMVLSKLQSLPVRPKILIYTAWGKMMEIAASLGADFFILKPSTPEIVCERVRQLVSFPRPVHAAVKAVPPSKMENQVTSILMEFGIPSYIRGFKYLRKAVTAAVEDPRNLEGITKNLYPNVAKSFETTPCRVERSIRHAIEVAWEQPNFEALKKYFGPLRYYEKSKPTNREFIAVLTEYIQMHDALSLEA